MLSTESGKNKKIEGKQAGVTGWIIKPFNPAQLITAINKIMR
jgi:two-component system chemotaxis response regulator CheY